MQKLSEVNATKLLWIALAVALLFLSVLLFDHLWQRRKLARLMARLQEASPVKPNQNLGIRA